MATVNTIATTLPATSQNTFLEEEAKRRMIAAQLLQKTALDPQNMVTTTGGGIAKLASGLLGGMMEGYAAKGMMDARQAEMDDGRKIISEMLPQAQAATPAPEATAPAAMPAANEPRGYRNLNPLNIEDGPFARSQPGYAGGDGRFAKFASMDQGIGAANKLMDVYGSKHGLTTPAGIISRWAPSSENDTAAYIASVAKTAGLDPNAPLTPETRAALVKAMALQENGKPLPSGPSPQAIGQALAPQPAQTGPSNELLVRAMNNRFSAPIAQQILAQRMQPKNATTVDLGNEVGIMRDGQIVERVAKSRDPNETEAKRLDLELKRKNLDASPTVQRVKQPDGSEVAVQWNPKTQAWDPLVAPSGGNPVAAPKLTEQQSKDVGFYNRGKNLLPRLEQQDKALTEFFSAHGGNVSNYFKSDQYRQAEQTGRELLAVILRKDTGAAVTPSEFEQYSSIYLPRPGDDAATVEQKRVARATAIEGLRMGLGPAEIIFKSQEAAAAAKPKAATPDRSDLEAEARRRGLIK